MRAILQRVSSASVEVGGRTVGAIGVGLLVLLGVEKDDDEVAAQRMVEKLAGLRIWSDAAGKMNLDAATAGAAFLVVSQFTLAADLSRGRRPSHAHWSNRWPQVSSDGDSPSPPGSLERPCRCRWSTTDR